MTGTEKWKALEHYLKELEKRVISGLKTSAMGETPNELRGFGAQLKLMGDILTQVERLDRDEEIIVGRLAPPKYKY